MAIRTCFILFMMLFAGQAQPQTFIDHFQRANQLVKEDKLSAAIEEYKKTIELHPRNVLARLQLGLVYANIGDYGQAERYLSEAIKLDPKSHRAHLNMALVYIQDNKLSKALEHLKKALSLEPNGIKAQYHLALIYDFQRDYSKAIAEYQKCIKLNPQYAKAYVGLGGAYYKAGEKSMALKQAQKLQDIKETDLANGLSRWIELQESELRN